MYTVIVFEESEKVKCQILPFLWDNEKPKIIVKILHSPPSPSNSCLHFGAKLLQFGHKELDGLRHVVALAAGGREVRQMVQALFALAESVQLHIFLVNDGEQRGVLAEKLAKALLRGANRLAHRVGEAARAELTLKRGKGGEGYGIGHKLTEEGGGILKNG